MAATRPRVLYRSAFRSLDGRSVLPLAYDGATVAGFPPLNAVDWRDWSLFRVAEGTTHLSATLVEERSLDALGWFVAAPDLTAGDYEIHLEWRVGSDPWTTLVSVHINDNGLLGLGRFPAVTLAAGTEIRVRFVVPAGEMLDVRCLVPGYLLTMPVGQHVGLAPPNLRGFFVPTNSISVGGSFIGRDLVRREIQGELVLEHLTEAWVRQYWQDFTLHLERWPYFYAWDYDRFPDEVCFAWAREIPRPENMSPTPLMRVTLPWSARIEPLPPVPFDEDGTEPTGPCIDAQSTPSVAALTEVVVMDVTPIEIV